MATDKKTADNGPTRDVNGQFAAGNSGGPGRPKGKANKFTSLKQAFLNALEAAGGDQFILEFARADPAKFLAIVGRMLPATSQQEHSLTPPVVAIREVVISGRDEVVEFAEFKRQFAEGNGESQDNGTIG